MKKNLQKLSILFFTVLFSACSVFDKEFGVTNTIPISFTSTTGNTINANISNMDFNDGEIKKHKDKIKDLVIEGIVFKVTQFTAATNNTANPMLNGRLEYAPSGTTNFKTATALSNVDLKALNASGTEVSAPVDATNKNDLTSLIEGGQKVDFRLVGTTTSPFASATIEFKIKSELTAGL
ncbi:hypothetical protein [Adhaeribacter aquaticus]|uniref:hypothetical protein n=1 Tax=Adhaeribacter aquaticus TaxID=299567 RepID=UPI00047972EC|nr:hypothetical protein [Adhaeribacter aquaticus]